MASNNPKVRERSDLTEGIGNGSGTLADLNDIMKEVLKQFQSSFHKRKLVTRCQLLPMVEGDPVRLREVFTELLSMIISPNKPGSQIFLHINCEVDEEGSQSSALTLRHHLIKFHTNITTSEDWKAGNREKIELCSSVLAESGAVFAVNQISSTGCLFSILMPGKY
jgi:hypothetical protein